MVKEHHVRVYKSEENLAREDQLAYKIAKVAADPGGGHRRGHRHGDQPDHRQRLGGHRLAEPRPDRRGPRPGPDPRPQPPAARAPRSSASTNASRRNGRPGPTASPSASSTTTTPSSPPSTPTRATTSRRSWPSPSTSAASGQDLVRGIATGYEIQVNLVKAICLHKHKIDHVAHLGPSAAAGIGTLLGLDVETIFQSVGQALHTTTATRQSRKGEISTWKAHAPAFAGKMAVEAVDRAMRGQTSPVPIYEGEDGVIAWMLDGPDASYTGAAARRRARPSAPSWTPTPRNTPPSTRPRPGSTSPASCTANTPSSRTRPTCKSVLIKTSHHTHYVIGSGANDPQKYDPTASRETLDHSIPYIFTVALQDGAWHHVDSYAPERAARPDTVELWHKVTTVEDPEWTRRYHSLDIAEKAFGGRVEITLTDGTVITDEIAVADAHPLGARPFAREQYVNKFRTLAAGTAWPRRKSNASSPPPQRLPELPPASWTS